MPLPIPESRDAVARIHRERKALAVARARTAPFHRARLHGIDLERLDDPEEWRKIPLLDKETLRGLDDAAFYRDFCVGPRGAIAEMWRSGGVTGKPLFYPRSFEDMRYGMLSFARVIEGLGGRRGDLAHVSFPLGIHPVGQLMARAAQSLGIGVTWAGAGNSTPSPAQIELIDRLQPRIWMGMSSYALHLANLAEAKGIDLPNSSVDLVICSAEQLTAAKRAKIERMWGAQVYDTFGMTEAGMMGCEGPARDGFHVWSDMYFVEVVDPDSGAPVADGETGSLVVTPLWTNHVTPFLRWVSGDVVSYREHGETDGPLAVFPVVAHAHRTAGFFKVRGINVNHTEFEDFMFADPAVGDFQAELATADGNELLRLRVEVVRGVEAGKAAKELAARTKTTFEVTPEVQVLERGTLAAEFEGQVKAPRFVDRRE